MAGTDALRIGPEPPAPPPAPRPGDRLEPEYAEAYGLWKRDPSPANSAALLGGLAPAIEGAVQAHVGAPNPLLLSRARRMALEALPGYDPQRARLQTHLFNRLQGLRRYARRQASPVRVPERVALGQARLAAAESDLAHELGREPTDAELTAHLGLTAKRLARLRAASSGVAEGTLEEAGGGGAVYGGVTPVGEARTLWRQLVYDDLPPLDQKIMEYALGLNGRRPLSNQDIARKLQRSPGAISQRKLAIQKLLDQEQELGGTL